VNSNQTKKNLNVTRVLEYLRQFEKFNSRHLFSANKIVKGSPEEIYELIIDIHNYYCKSYLPSKSKERKRIQKINSFDFDHENYNYPTNDKITSNQETLRVFMKNNSQGKDSNCMKFNKNSNFMNRVNSKKNEDNSNPAAIIKNYNYNNKYKTENNQKIEYRNKNQKAKKNDYYSVNSFDFSYKIFASEEELKDRV